MRGILAARSIIMLIAYGGCTFDLTEVVPDIEAPRLTVELTTTRGSTATLNAALHPGTTADGIMRDLVDDSIRIDGVSFSPIEYRPDGWLLYEVPALAIGAPLIVVEPPHVPGLAPPFPTVALDVIRIVAPDTLVVARGGLLEIGVTGISATREYMSGHWTLGISPEEGPPTLTVNGNGTPPPVISVSTASLPPELTRGMIHVHVESGRVNPAPGNAYAVFIRSSATAVIPFRIKTP